MKSCDDVMNTLAQFWKGVPEPLYAIICSKEWLEKIKDAAVEAVGDEKYLIHLCGVKIIVAPGTSPDFIRLLNKKTWDRFFGPKISSSWTPEDLV